MSGTNTETGSAISATTGVEAGSHFVRKEKDRQGLGEPSGPYSESVGQPIYVDSCKGELTGHHAHYPTFCLPRTPTE